MVSFRPASFGLEVMSIPLEAFAKLEEYPFGKGIRDVYIIENETVFLSFPKKEGSLIVYGGGFKVTTLRRVAWLRNYPLHYFGDLDEHGFEILSLFRSIFPHAESFCMDKATLEAYDQYRVEGKNVPGEEVFSGLTADEMDTLMELRGDLKRNRLEQERIENSFIVGQLSKEDV